MNEENIKAVDETVAVSEEELAEILDDQMDDAVNQAQGNNAPQQPKLMFNDMSDYLDTRFGGEIAEFQKYKNRKTGYPNVDAVQSLYAGFMLIGGGNGSGKTTYCFQEACQIAATGVPVLYFSMEQSVLELTSKALSRYIFQHKLFVDDTYRAYTSLEIRNGDANGTRELTEQVDAFKNAVGNNLCIVQCNNELTIEFLIDTVRGYIQENKVKPTIFIDYLQIMSPSIVNGRPLTDTKTNLDHVIHVLKAFQMSRGLTVIAICSFNRQSYLTPIDFTSLKESGALEYGCDWCGGIEMSIVDKDSYLYKPNPKNPDKIIDTTDVDKREMMKAEKNRIPRRVQLSVIKNRYGRASYKCYFEYYSAYDTFIALDDDGNQYKPDGTLIPGYYKQQEEDAAEKREEEAKAKQEELENPDSEQEADAIASQQKVLAERGLDEDMSKMFSLKPRYSNGKLEE